MAKAWTDEAFKGKLFANPGAVMRAEELEIPEGTDLRLVEARENEVVLVLPARSAAGDIVEGEQRLAACH